MDKEAKVMCVNTWGEAKRENRAQWKSCWGNNNVMPRCSSVYRENFLPLFIIQ